MERTHAGRVRMSGLDGKGQHRTPQPALLRHRQVVLGVARKSGVKDAVYCGVVFQPFAQCQRLCRLGLHPNAQRLQALEHDPRVKRSQGHTTTLEDGQEFLGHHLLTCTQGTRHDTALSIQKLGA